jgi:hypothetical protein
MSIYFHQASVLYTGFSRPELRSNARWRTQSPLKRGLKTLGKFLRKGLARYGTLADYSPSGLRGIMHDT